MGRVRCKESETFLTTLFSGTYILTFFSSIFILNGFDFSFFTYFMIVSGLVSMTGGVLDPGDGSMAASLIAIQVFILVVCRVLGLVSGIGCLFTMVGIVSLTAALVGFISGCRGSI